MFRVRHALVAFGRALVTRATKQDSSRSRWTICWSPTVSAADPPPEIVENNAHDKKVDIWSVGVVVCELMVVKPPIESVMTVDSRRRIRTIDLRFPDYVSEPVRNLITVVLGTRPRDWCVYRVLQCVPSIFA